VAELPLLAALVPDPSLNSTSTIGCWLNGNTLKTTVSVCGLFVAFGPVTVIVPVYVPRLRPALEKLTVCVTGAPLDVPFVGETLNHGTDSDNSYCSVPVPALNTLNVRLAAFRPTPLVARTEGGLSPIPGVGGGVIVMFTGIASG